MGSHEKQNQLIYSWFIYNFEVSGRLQIALSIFVDLYQFLIFVSIVWLFRKRINYNKTIEVKKNPSPVEVS
jgi:hypothetical protein